MNQPDEILLTEIRNIFWRVMGSEVVVNLSTVKPDLAEWDSINHLDLIVEIEEKFNLNLSMKEIEEIDSVKKIIQLVTERRLL